MTLSSRLRLTVPGVLTVASVLLLLGAVAYVCLFKIADSDFWWHVKAGEIMVQTRGLIATEPFAYTRAGQPYLATHEWLAQVILYGVFHLGGVTGIIWLRIAAVAAVALLLLSIDRRRVWINAPIAATAIAIALPGFVDRPQLFSYVLFATFLAIVLRLLDLPAGDQRTRRRFLLVLFIFHVLWVNMHGAAAVMGLLLFAAFGLQRVVILSRQGMAHHRRELIEIVATGLALLAGLLLSPSGLGNIAYLGSLLQDRTVGFISEWVARSIYFYLREVGPFWALSLLALAWARRQWVFWIVVIGVTGFLSRLAFRHEIFFILSATGMFFHQLGGQLAWQEWTDTWRTRLRIAVPVMLILWAAAIAAGHYKSTMLKQPNDLFGFGTFEPGKGAADFLIRVPIAGALFNDYSIGGYLDYRFHPQPVVFIDGRNVDFGYDFIKAALDAGQDPAAWQTLEDRYGFTRALISYGYYADIDPIPYVSHLSKNPRWSLVYLDDWSAVYLRDIPANKSVIAEHGYRLLTPEGLTDATVLDSLTQEDAAMLERELLRSIAGSQNSIKPRLLLARLYVLAGLTDDAVTMLRRAHGQWPRRYEPLELLAGALAVQGKWREAGATYEQAVALARNADIDYGAIADVFEKAGDERKAAYYRRKAR